MVNSATLGLRWWYTAGWRWVWRGLIMGYVTRTSEAFSMLTLLRTLGAPYRQTFSGSRGGSLDAWFHAVIDNIISRVVGLFVRLFLLLAGSICCLVVFAVGLMTLSLWAFIPVLPLISIALALMGWTL